MLADDSSIWDSFAAQFKTVRRPGIALVGPSGAGKSSLFNYLAGKKPTHLALTAERVYESARFGGRYIQVTDTPGSEFQVNLKKETHDFVKSSKLDVLVILLGHGYLDTVGHSGLERPGKKGAYNSITEYRAATLQEEIDWLIDFGKKVIETKKKIAYCMVAINKLDLWESPPVEVLAYYRTLFTRPDIFEGIERLCKKNTKPSFHPIHCTYNSFKGSSPKGEYSIQSSALSLAVFRAELAQRMAEVAS